jgi:DNA modification methylase
MKTNHVRKGNEGESVIYLANKMKKIPTKKPLHEADILELKHEKTPMFSQNVSEIIVSPNKGQIDSVKVSELAESIQRIGLINPIVITPDKQLVCGLHRLEAFKSLGLETIPVTVKNYAQLEKELAEVNEDVMRKHLSALVQGELINRRDLVLSSMGIRAKTGDNQHSKKSSAIIAAPKTTKNIANALGISERSVQLKKQVARDLDDSIKDKIRKTQLANSVTSLLEISKLPPKQQVKLALKLSGTEDKAKIDRKINEIIRQENVQKAHKKAKDFEGIEGFEWYTGDFAEICKGMPDNSIDAIVTDPPYYPKYLHVWKSLGVEAFRLLKPSGFLVAYTGINHLPEVINNLLSGGLNYYWVATIAYLGNHRMPTIEKNVYGSTRPVLIFQKPPFQAVQNAFVDLIRCDEKKEKDLHPWQQNLEPFRYFIQRFTKQNDLILEPFAGSGTTALAALIEKRRCISIDIKEDNIKAAKGRIQGYLEEEKLMKAA